MAEQLSTTCCIAGGGPAGMMLGLLLARAGVPVVVLEKHADFFRDFRGDTIHPSTMTVMQELGLLDDFLAQPHQKVDRISGQFGDEPIRLADFYRLNIATPYIAMMPQWDFLSFLSRHAKAFPAFSLLMSTSVSGLIEEGGRVVGVRTSGPDGQQEIRAALVVGADGRHSTVRGAAGLQVRDLGAPIDVFWFHLSKKPSDGEGSLGRFDRGRIAVTINRGSYWQCAFVIAKGASEAVHAKGLDAFRNAIEGAIPWAGDGRTAEIASWDDVKLLSVTVDRLETWHRPGLLMIGDAAHAMSPVGGVGINLAIQDAVAAANQIAAPLKSDTLSQGDLAAVQQRRLWPTKVTQEIQLVVQRRVIQAALTADKPLRAPWIARMLFKIPFVRSIPARLIGIGVRPEHVRSPAA